MHDDSVSLRLFFFESYILNDNDGFSVNDAANGDDDEENEYENDYYKSVWINSLKFHHFFFATTTDYMFSLALAWMYGWARLENRLLSGLILDGKLQRRQKYLLSISFFALCIIYSVCFFFAFLCTYVCTYLRIFSRRTFI